MSLATKIQTLVTATTVDLIDVINNSGATVADYDIVIVGTSA